MELRVPIVEYERLREVDTTSITKPVFQTNNRWPGWQIPAGGSSYQKVDKKERRSGIVDSGDVDESSGTFPLRLAD